MDLSMRINGRSDFASEASKAYNLGGIAKANPTLENIFEYLKVASKGGPHFYPYGGREGLLETLEKADAFLPKMNESSLGEMNGSRLGENIQILTILVGVASVYHLGPWLRKYNAILDKIYI